MAFVFDNGGQLMKKSPSIAPLTLASTILSLPTKLSSSNTSNSFSLNEASQQQHDDKYNGGIW